MQRANQASKALFQRDHRGRNLILKKRIAPVGVDSFNSRGYHRVAGHCKRQAIDDHAAQLFALHIHPLPER